MPTGESLAIAPATSQAQVNELEREAQRLGLQLQRLAAALADGDDLPSVLAALREKEARRGTIQGQIQALQRGTSSLSLLADFERVQGELEHRLEDWRGMLSGEVGQARRMVRTMLDGRLMFTPGATPELCTYTGRGH